MYPRNYFLPRLPKAVLHPMAVIRLGYGLVVKALLLSPNPRMDTDGRREDSGRGVRELQAR